MIGSRPSFGHWPTFFIALCVLAFCPVDASAQDATSGDKEMNAEPSAPSVVEVRQTDDGWELLRDGEPLLLRGVGGGGDRFPLLAEIGGNAWRTWGVGDDTADSLDDAQANGISVILTIWLPHARDGKIDYADADFQKQLRADVRNAVEAHRDHPALLAWSLGNEAESGNTNPKAYWSLLEDLAALVQELDPNHPVMTTTADLGPPDQPFGKSLREHCPSIDIWGINSYGGMFSMKQRLADQRNNGGWTGPHIIMEFGAIGQWEVAKAFDEAPLEQTSTEKALQMAMLWQEQIAGDSNCLGGFAFLWGEKQESTHTWFGMFVDGRPTAAVDVLHRQWRGDWPGNLAPIILRLDGDSAGAFTDPIAVGSQQSAQVSAFDPEGQPLTFEWTLQPLGGIANNFGQHEDRPDDLSALLRPAGKTVTFTAPKDPGIYRLFVVVQDKAGKVATANIPIKVTPQ